MTAKRFRVQEHCLRSSYGIEAENWLVTNDNHCVVLNDKAEAHMVANMSNDVIDKFNALHEENEQLKSVNMEYEDALGRLEEENEELRNNLENWIQRTLKAHGYFNILEKVIDEVCDDDISNQIWKEYEERERLIE